MTTTVDTTTDVDVITEIVDYLNTYMHFPSDDYPLTLALWILHTYTFAPDFPKSPWTTPYLYVYSDGPGCGKTMLMELLEGLIRNPIMAASMSASSMFRLMEDMSPTIMLDEIDTVFRGVGNGPAKYEDLRNTLNSGYKHNGFTYRVEGGNAEKFRTFGPKLLAGIRDDKAEIPATVLTRSIRFKLDRKPLEVEKETYYSFMAGPVAEALSEVIRAWIKVNAERIANYMPKPGSFQNRDFELAMPLLQIAHAAGIETDVRYALQRMFAPEAAKETTEDRHLRIIRETFDALGRDSVHTAELCEALGGINGKLLSAMLKPYGITGNSTISSIKGRKPAKGYRRHQFTEVWERRGI